MNFNEEKIIQVTCERGLVVWLSAELAALGYTVIREHKTGVEIRGTLQDCERICLQSRLAYNVLYLLDEFRCADEKALYKRASDLPWESIIRDGGYFSIDCRVRNDTIRDTRYPVLRLKDAIADRMTKQTGRRANSGKEHKGAVVQLNWQDDRAWIYLNAAGNKLSDRGYRKMPHLAPLRETLASGILAACEYVGERPFVNPMCGSGTLAIEAALLARDSFAGTLRANFGFQHLVGYDPEFYQTLRSELNEKKAQSGYPQIVATDIDPKAIEAAKHNARTAGVDTMIEFAVCDFADTVLPDMPGIIVMNPEYGNRLGEQKTLEPVYGRIGDWFKQKCKGWTGYVFTGNLNLAKKVGLKAERRFEFFNAKIDCRLLKYGIY